MAHLLHIDASPRGSRSQSRRVTKVFVDAWVEAHPGATVSYRNVGHVPPPHIDEDWVAAAATPPGERTREMHEALRTSDELIDEFLEADVYVIGLPMYNFGVPSGFKAYIDQVVRGGRTFSFEPEEEEQPYKPLVCGRKAFVVVATGSAGYETGGRHERLNHIDPYVRTVFGFIGVTDVEFVHVGSDELEGHRLARSIADTRARLVVATSGPLRHPSDQRRSRDSLPEERSRW